MLDPLEASRALQHHLDTVTREEFVANMRRFNPDIAADPWGPGDELVDSDARGQSPADAPGIDELRGIDPVIVRRALREYFATASDQQIVDDLRRISPELAARLGLNAEPDRAAFPRRTRRVRGFFGGIGRSVMRLFS